MTRYLDYTGRLIKMGESYPIYNMYTDEVIGYTEVGDMAVITHSSKIDDYYETIIVSGKYIGVDTLALENIDLEKCTFVFNHIDVDDTVEIGEKQVTCEYR